MISVTPCLGEGLDKILSDFWSESKCTHLSDTNVAKGVEEGKRRAG